MNDNSGEFASIQIKLLDHDPNGVRFAKIPASVVKAVVFRRDQFKIAREQFKEFKGAAVYILIGPREIGPDEKNHGKKIAYIGYSGEVESRIYNHWNGKLAKEFWTDAVVLFGTEDFTTARARFVESSLFSKFEANHKFEANQQWALFNSNSAAEDAGKLPDSLQMAYTRFVDESIFLVGALGWDLFRKPDPSEETRPRPSENPTFSYSGRGFAATMEVDASGMFIVKKGSEARGHETSTLPPGAKAERKVLGRSKYFKKIISFKFTRDHSFKSVSAAAGVVSGTNASGKTAWKRDDGTTYGDWENNMQKNKKPPS